MMDKVYRTLYSSKWLLWHVLLSVITIAPYGFLLAVLKIDYHTTLKLISKDTITLSASMAGFVFAGMSIFVSLDGNKKMSTIASVGQDNIIYSILIFSVSLFVSSLLLMGIDLVVFNISIEQISSVQMLAKSIVEWASIYTLLLGFLCFLSGLKLIHWVLKK